MDDHRLGVAGMTHCDRVLALLADGEPHSHHELYSLYVIGHSRVADLRRQGHVIDCWRDGDLYLYQLSLDPAAPPPQVCAAGSSEGVTASGAHIPGLTANETPPQGAPPLDYLEEPRQVEAAFPSAASLSGLASTEPSSEPIHGQLQIGEAA